MVSPCSPFGNCENDNPDSINGSLITSRILLNEAYFDLKNGFFASFLIVSTLANPNVIKVSNPKASSDTKAKQTVVVTIDKDQKLYIGATAVTIEALPGELKSFLAKETEKPSVVINGDSVSNLGVTIQVMQIIKSLGATPVVAVNPAH